MDLQGIYEIIDPPFNKNSWDITTVSITHSLLTIRPNCPNEEYKHHICVYTNQKRKLSSINIKRTKKNLSLKYEKKKKKTKEQN